MDANPGPRPRDPPAQIDSEFRSRLAETVCVTGSGCCVFPPGAAATLDVLPYLKNRKMRKFMGKQDQLAVVAAGIALQERGLPAAALRERCGIYLAVGYIPFERDDIEAMARHSVADGQFSIEQFSTAGIEQVNPLLTFRCLPNMPIFHVSVNFGIQGPYFVTYPGVAQFYAALERALAALSSGEIDFALVGGVADQDNFLVEFDRRRKPDLKDRVAHDAAAFLLLERRGASAVTQSQPTSEAFSLAALDIGYRPYDPWTDAGAHAESFAPVPDDETSVLRARAVAVSAGAHLDASGVVANGPYLGAASLPAWVDAARRSDTRGTWRHIASTRDGCDVRSLWQR